MNSAIGVVDVRRMGVVRRMGDVRRTVVGGKIRCCRKQTGHSLRIDRTYRIIVSYLGGRVAVRRMTYLFYSIRLSSFRRFFRKV